MKKNYWRFMALEVQKMGFLKYLNKSSQNAANTNGNRTEYGICLMANGPSHKNCRVKLLRYQKTLGIQFSKNSCTKWMVLNSDYLNIKWSYYRTRYGRTYSLTMISVFIRLTTILDMNINFDFNFSFSGVLEFLF